MDGLPAVEMLWESADPGQELAKRFGFRDGSAAARWVADVLGRYWELDVVRCDRLVISGRNIMAWVEAGGRRFIGKWSSLPHRFSRLEDVARLVAWLDTEGLVPVAALSVEDSGQVDDAGRMLATLHQALADYPGPMGGRGRRGRGQLVHNDFRSANVLHDGTAISAVLDFEEITYDTRAADIAKAAVLLATRYRDWGPTSESVRAAFVCAYDDHARDPLTTMERREIDERMAIHLTAFGWVETRSP